MATTNEITEIKERVHIYDIASTYVQLKKSGANYFGLCPFHNEKSPSFSVNDDLGIFKCFGCGESGDVISFVEKIENISFKEAIEKLADKAGIQLTNEFIKENSERKRILEINSLANEMFKYLLNKHKAGEVAREYLKKRNINSDSLSEFSLGYDHKDFLVNVLLSRGFTSKEIIDYGLGVIRNGVLVDKYRERIIFPIYSVAGDVVGFSGRIIENNPNIPKYINSPETEVFKKNNILFGLYNSKKYIKAKDNAVLLEGPIDVISAYQNGVKNVCAVQGTSLTSNHLNVLRRFTQSISFCFDQDSAGLKALRRSFLIACSTDLNVKVININGAKDVDEKVNNDIEGFREDMDNPIDVIEYLINKDCDENNISALDGKLKVINDILPLISSLQDNIKKNYYVKRLADSVEVDSEEVKKMLVNKTQKYKEEVVRRIEKNIKGGNRRLDYLLSLFLQHYKYIQDIILKFDESYIYNPNTRSLVLKLKEAIKENKDIRTFVDSLETPEKNFCINLMTINIKELRGDDIEYVKKEIESIEKLLRRRKAIEDINELKNKLWIYEKDNDDDKINELLKRMSQLTKEI